MNKKNKTILTSGIIAGTFYAGSMVGFDYYNGQDFSIWRFLFNFLYFAIIMGFMTRYVKKHDEKEKNN